LNKDIHKSEKQDKNSLIQVAQEALNQSSSNSDLSIKFAKQLDQTYSTSPQTSPAALLVVLIQESEDSKPIKGYAPGPQEVWKAAFNARYINQYIDKLNGQDLDQTQIQYLL
jgi:hypothetical protein